ncbi:MAG: SdrD B-like domain-containing protein [Desulfobulbaceae bacterium]
MKKKALFILIFVTILMSHSQAGCAQEGNDLSFTQGEHRYIIDTESGAVLKTGPDGSRIEFLGSPAAGAVESTSMASPLHPAIINYYLVRNGSINGHVWEDLNGNFLPDAGERGVPDISVFIDMDNSETYTYSDPVVLTDGNGNYVFPRIKAGTRNVYIDIASLPTGYGVITGLPITLNITKNQKIKDVDFGLQTLPGTVTGTIWDQTDNTFMAGVMVYIDRDNNSQLSSGDPSGMTDGTGSYRISGIPTGAYKLYVNNSTLDAKYHRTPITGTNPTLVSVVPDGSQTIHLTYLHKATICGLLQDASGRSWADITVFIDFNNNGTYDAGEPSEVTDPSGKYCFDELYPGTYTLLINQSQLPAGYDLLLSPGAITVGAGVDDTANFTTYQPITISGLVWDDASGNRVPESAENGLADITVYLDANNNSLLDGGELTTRTRGSGAFSFTGLESGAFYIKVDDTVLRKVYNQTTAANPLIMTLEPGQSYDGARFGYQKKLAPVHDLYYPTRLGWASNGTLYVSDSQLNSVFIYDSTLKLAGELKNLDKPLGVTTDGAGNIYVGNEGRKNVEVYDSLGNLLRTIGSGSIAMPNDLALDSNNNLYVLDSAGNRVLVYDQAGNPLTTIGGAPWTGFARSIAIAYRGPAGVAVGELYVADGPNCTIHVFGLDGAYQKSIGTFGSLYTTNWDGKFSGLSGVEIDQFGNVHGLDNNLNVVQVFEPQNGTFLRSYKAYPPENEYRLNLQTDFAIQPIDQRVVVSNLATRTIETITSVTAP